MISEGSCDTEDWSNDAENSALSTGINYINFSSIRTFLIYKCSIGKQMIILSVTLKILAFSLFLTLY